MAKTAQVRTTLTGIGIDLPTVPDTVHIGLRGVTPLGAIPIGALTDRQLNDLAKNWKHLLLTKAQDQRHRGFEGVLVEKTKVESRG